MNDRERDELRQAAERTVREAFLECSHPSLEHIWNAHRECRWCHTSQERYDAAIVATAWLADSAELTALRDAINGYLDVYECLTRGNPLVSFAVGKSVRDAMYSAVEREPPPEEIPPGFDATNGAIKTHRELATLREKLAGLVAKWRLDNDIHAFSLENAADELAALLTPAAKE